MYLLLVIAVFCIIMPLFPALGNRAFIASLFKNFVTGVTSAIPSLQWKLFTARIQLGWKASGQKDLLSRTNNAIRLKHIENQISTDHFSIPLQL